MTERRLSTPPAVLSPEQANRIKCLGRAVIETEAQAVATLAERLDESFVAACAYMLNCEGRIVVLGMGKSGHIGGKIAATLASTGSPAFFVHPGEAGHGDLGMITQRDVVLAISNSGETDEILIILPILKRLGVPLIVMTGRRESTLAREADVYLDVSVVMEACPLGLAPTSSTTAALAMGDALAIALLESRGFTAEDFARSHPAGRLGRRLLVHVDDVMHQGERLPKVALGTPLLETLEEISRKGLGMSAVVNPDGTLAGIFTDGDLRRALDRGIDVHHTLIDTVMTRQCVTIQSGALAVEAVQLMESRAINGLLVVDAGGRLIGAFNMHDLLRAGVV
ncbi:MAG: KpsF/GutQ family sugar-phosphate isomerase [Thermochromatium sp.]